MFETIKDFILTHESQAPWVIFFSIVLAGLNLPVSIDLMIILVAVLAATHLAHMKLVLFLSFFAGCCVSAWVSYTLGRTIGSKLLRKFFSESKLALIENYLTKYGTVSLFIGRFIPFGFRNCLFMTTGFSKMPFIKFAIVDFFACLIWSSVFFTLFYQLGQSFEALQQHLKIINICIAVAFGVTLISFFCYKYKKRLQE
jgi:membrane protein DedA with SNARE-associated domain